RSRAGDEFATQLFAQLARQRGEVVGITGFTLAARLPEHLCTVLAHQQAATGVIADHRRDDVDAPVAHNRLYDHDCMRPSLYGITPWNGRGSPSNTSGRKWRSPSHIGSSISLSRATQRSVPSWLAVSGVPL